MIGALKKSFVFFQSGGLLARNEKVLSNPFPTRGVCHLISNLCFSGQKFGGGI
jgi:hypothetical protein